MAAQPDKALEILETLQDRAQRQHVVAYAFAPLYVGLGDHDKAIEALWRDYEEDVHAFPALAQGFPGVRSSAFRPPVHRAAAQDRRRVGMTGLGKAAGWSHRHLVWRTLLTLGCTVIGGAQPRRAPAIMHARIGAVSDDIRSAPAVTITPVARHRFPLVVIRHSLCDFGARQGRMQPPLAAFGRRTVSGSGTPLLSPQPLSKNSYRCCGAPMHLLVCVIRAIPPTEPYPPIELRGKLDL